MLQSFLLAVQTSEQRSINNAANSNAAARHLIFCQVMLNGIMRNSYSWAIC